MFYVTGQTALTYARESSTQKCVPLIEEYARTLNIPISLSEQSQSWEDVTTTGEAESDEAEEVEEEDESVSQFESSPSPVAHRKQDEVVSITSDDPNFGTVRFKEPSKAASPSENVQIVKPVTSISSPRSKQKPNDSLLNQLTKSKDESAENEPELKLSGGLRGTASFDLTSDVVKTSLDSVTSGMTTEWDSATEPTSARKGGNNGIPKSPDYDDDDDWSENGPSVHLPVSTTAPIEVTIPSTSNKEEKLSSLVAEVSLRHFYELFVFFSQVTCFVSARAWQKAVTKGLSI